MRGIPRSIAAPVLALCLVVGVRADRVRLNAAGVDTEPYHERVRQQAMAIPVHLGSWLGTDTPVPPSAVKLLHPNVVVSRGYQELLGGRQIALLIVQCKDARDLVGHWPPVCYVSQGWVKQSATPRDWRVDGLAIPGMQYEFASSKPGRLSHLVVDDFFVLPDGRLERDMSEVDAVARNPRKKFYGAAQIQIVSDGTLAEQEHEEVLAMFVRAARPMIDAVREGVAQ